jgi:hypothetical protein
MPIIIKRSRKSRKSGSFDLDGLECLLEIIGCIGGIVAMVLAAFVAAALLFVGITLLVLLLVNAIRKFGLARNARFYKRSIWLGSKRLDTTQIQQLLVLIERSSAGSRLIFEVTDKSGKTRRFPLDPDTLKPDQIEKVAADIQAFGSRHYPFPVEIGRPATGSSS